VKALFSYLNASVGKKQVVGATGFLLLGFLATHLGGNLTMLKGGGMFDAYAEHLINFPLIIPAEIGLAALFLTHIFFGVRVTWENWNARPQGYAVHVNAGGRTIGSGTMIYTGLLTLLFLCIHITVFKFQHPEGTSLFSWVIHNFHKPLTMGFYVLAMASLGLHLSHGIESALQTFGIHHPKYTPLLGAGGLFLAVLLAVGFGFLPPWGASQ